MSSIEEIRAQVLVVISHTQDLGKLLTAAHTVATDTNGELMMLGLGYSNAPEIRPAITLGSSALRAIEMAQYDYTSITAAMNTYLRRL
jgi:hypothetical protein